MIQITRDYTEKMKVLRAKQVEEQTILRTLQSLRNTMTAEGLPLDDVLAQTAAQQAKVKATLKEITDLTNEYQRTLRSGAFVNKKVR